MFDLDWKIDDAMQRLNLTIEPDEVDEVERIDLTNLNIRATFFYEKLNIWKKGIKANLRYNQDLREAIFMQNTPLSYHFDQYVNE